MENICEKQVTRVRPSWRRCSRWLTIAVLGYTGWSLIPSASVEGETIPQSRDPENYALRSARKPLFGGSLFQRGLEEKGHFLTSAAVEGGTTLNGPSQHRPSLTPAVLPQKPLQFPLKNQLLANSLFPQLSHLASSPPLTVNAVHQTQNKVLSEVSKVSGDSKSVTHDMVEAPVSPSSNGSTHQMSGIAPLSLLSRATAVPLSASSTDGTTLNGFEAAVSPEEENNAKLQGNEAEGREATEENQASQAFEAEHAKDESNGQFQQGQELPAADLLSDSSTPPEEPKAQKDVVSSNEDNNSTSADITNSDQIPPLSQPEQNPPGIHQPPEADGSRLTNTTHDPAEVAQNRHITSADIPNESDSTFDQSQRTLNMKQEVLADSKRMQSDDVIAQQSGQPPTPITTTTSLELPATTPPKPLPVKEQMIPLPQQQPISWEQDGTTDQKSHNTDAAPSMPAMVTDQPHPAAPILRETALLNPDFGVPRSPHSFAESFYRGPESQNHSSSHQLYHPDSLEQTRAAEIFSSSQPVDSLSSYLSVDASPMQRVPLHATAANPAVLPPGALPHIPDSAHLRTNDMGIPETRRDVIYPQYTLPQHPPLPVHLTTEQQIDQQLQQLQQMQQDQLQPNRQIQQSPTAQHNQQLQPEGAPRESGNTAAAESPPMRSHLLSPLELSNQLLSNPLAVVQETVGRVGPMLGLSSPAPSSGVRSVEGVGSALASPGQALSVANLASEASTLSAAANNIATTGNSFMNALPLDQMVDMAKAVQSISDKEEESLRNPSLQPGVRCANGGITCCVPEAMAPRDWKRRPPLLNDSDEKQKHCRAHFVPIQNALCATTTYEGGDTCGLSKTETQEYEVYRHVLVMRHKGQRAVCECRRLKNPTAAAEGHADGDGQHQPGTGFEGFATWEVTQDQRKQQKEMKESSARMAQGLGTTLKVAQFLGEKGPETLQALQALQSQAPSTGSSFSASVPVNASAVPSFPTATMPALATAQPASVSASSYAVPSPVYVNPNYAQQLALSTNSPQVLVGASAEGQRRDLEVQQQQELMQRQLAHQQSVQQLLALQQQQQQLASMQQQAAVSNAQSLRSAPQAPVQPPFDTTPYFGAQQPAALHHVQNPVSQSPPPLVEEAAVYASAGGQPNIGRLPAQVVLQEVQPQMYEPVNAAQKINPPHLNHVQVLQQPTMQVLQQPFPQQLQQVPQNQVQVVQMHAHTQPVAPPQPTGVLNSTPAAGMAAKAAAAVSAVMNAAPKKDPLNGVSSNSSGGSKSDVAWMGRVADALLEESNRTPGGAAINRALDDFLAVAKRAV